MAACEIDAIRCIYIWGYDVSARYRFIKPLPIRESVNDLNLERWSAVKVLRSLMGKSFDVLFVAFAMSMIHGNDLATNLADGIAGEVALYALHASVQGRKEVDDRNV